MFLLINFNLQSLRRTGKGYLDFLFQTGRKLTPIGPVTTTRYSNESANLDATVHDFGIRADVQMQHWNPDDLITYQNVKGKNQFTAYILSPENGIDF